MIRAPFALVDCYVSDARALSCCIIAAFPRFCLPHQWFALSLSLFFLFWFISFIIVTQVTLPSLASVWLALWFRFQSNTCPLWQVHRVTLKVFRYLLSHGWAVPTCTVSNPAHRKGNFPPSQSRTNRYKIWRLWCSAWRYSCYSYGISLCVTATTRELFS